ncbi:MAG: MATE family efflux transporter [Defluviimonas denitrificans]
MTAIDTPYNLGPDPAPVHLSWSKTWSDLLHMAWPIMLGAGAMALLHTGQASLLGHVPDTRPLYLLSMLQPWYLLFFAFLEALAITAQVFSARSCKAWPKGGIKVAVLLLSLLSLAITAGLLWCVRESDWLLIHYFKVLDEATLAVLPAYILTLAPFALFEILNGTMRGQGRTLPGLIVLGIAVVINLGVTYYLLHAVGMGIEALFYGNLVSGGAATLLMAGVVLFWLDGSGPAPLLPSVIRAATLLAVVGAPVFLSMVVGFFSSTVLFGRMAEFGSEHASGFLLATRLRFFMLIPATALATSLAVLLNQDNEADGGGAHHMARLLQSATGLLVFYAVLVAALYAAQPFLIAALAEDQQVRTAADAMLTLLLPTYIIVAFVVFCHVVMENLGRGGRVLFWTLLLEGPPAGRCCDTPPTSTAQCGC